MSLIDLDALLAIQIRRNAASGSGGLALAFGAIALPLYLAGGAVLNYVETELPAQITSLHCKFDAARNPAIKDHSTITVISNDYLEPKHNGQCSAQIDNGPNKSGSFVYWNAGAKPSTWEYK